MLFPSLKRGVRNKYIMKKNYIYTNQSIMLQAKKLRGSMTDAEKMMWEQLRNRKFLGLKFRRQYTIGKFITDFYCSEKNLIIELDGSIHNLKDQKDYDQERELTLKDNEFKIIRFKNYEIIKNLDNTLKKLEDYIKSL
jgi:very-short-patch-repair endonuclease